MTKYGVLDLYDEDMKKRYVMDNEVIHYVKKDGMYLIGIIDQSSTDHEYFVVHEYLFDRILAIHHN